ncbi:interleukin-3-like [Oryctolagus cuniculus]|uniref:interleukin-3-like n=1 Tax=Oryctolagus cuniculus TaxID=9986 RepID=UPI00387A4CCB
MHLASLNTSSLLVLHLLLLLFSLGLQAPIAQEYCDTTIDEIAHDLSMLSPLFLKDSVHDDDKQILKNQTLLKTNLCAFQEALETFKGNTSNVLKNLKSLEQCLPQTIAKGNPIRFEDCDWEDFSNKLKYYLNILSAALPHTQNPRTSSLSAHAHCKLPQHKAKKCSSRRTEDPGIPSTGSEGFPVLLGP